MFSTQQTVFVSWKLMTSLLAFPGTQRHVFTIEFKHDLRNTRNNQRGNPQYQVIWEIPQDSCMLTG